jgi:anaerobic selenocysteine-containing dehydrogenase
MDRVSTDRRDFVKAAGALAMATAASSLGMRDASAQQVPYSAGTEAPKLKAPPNAC